jgi:hypothetical protein
VDPAVQGRQHIKLEAAGRAVDLQLEIFSAWQRGTLRLPILSASFHTMAQDKSSASTATAVSSAASSACMVQVMSDRARPERVGSPGVEIARGR